MSTGTILCELEPANWLLFSSNVPPLIYYSHIPNIIIAISLAIFILVQNRKALANKILFFTILAFEVWVFFALAFWATNRGDMVMFAWLMDILVEPLVYIGCLYLLYVLIDGEDISFSKKLFLSILYLPVPLFLPTDLMLSAFDPVTCLAEEGPLALYYTYFVEILVTIWVIWFCIDRFSKTKGNKRREIIYLGIGTTLMLVAFAWGNIVGSFSDNWQLGDYGLFGMPVFLAFLVYSIVKFRLFNIKVIGATALVVTMWALTGSLLAIQDIETIRYIVAITFVILLIVGWYLIKSVRNEISQREEIEKLADDLKEANDGQANLIHIINHQIKGYLSKSRNIFSELISDSIYGPISEPAKPLLDEGLRSLSEGVEFVKEFLDAANVEKGTYAYNMEPLDFKTLVSEAAEHQKGFAEQRGLNYEVNLPEGNYSMKGDRGELSQAVKNLIDNSIRYTKEGNLWINLERKKNKILLSVKDTGVGISEELKPKLFTQGGRDKNSIKINVNSTGFGLSFVKGVVEAHKGRVWAESPGPNLGSTFFMELPVN